MIIDQLDIKSSGAQNHVSNESLLVCETDIVLSWWVDLMTFSMAEILLIELGSKDEDLWPLMAQ